MTRLLRRVTSHPGKFQWQPWRRDLQRNPRGREVLRATLTTIGNFVVPEDLLLILLSHPENSRASSYGSMMPASGARRSPSGVPRFAVIKPSIRFRAFRNHVAS